MCIFMHANIFRSINHSDFILVFLKSKLLYACNSAISNFMHSVFLIFLIVSFFVPDGY
jgi:hypothetical protein